MNDQQILQTEQVLIKPKTVFLKPLSNSVITHTTNAIQVFTSMTSVSQMKEHSWSIVCVFSCERR